MLPPKEELRICFGHHYYDFKAQFDARGTGIEAVQAYSQTAFEQEFAKADIVVTSKFWRNDYLAQSGRLKFLQSLSSGMNQYDTEGFATAGIRLTSATGVSRNAVSEQAMALILAQTRRLFQSRDEHHKRFWRSSVNSLSEREDELAGKTLLIIGLGAIGNRLAKLAKAFDMNVIGVRRSRADDPGNADEVHAFQHLNAQFPRADFVCLTCPLNSETRHIINKDTLKLMKPSAHLINVSRGSCVDEEALVFALLNEVISGASLDTAVVEPVVPSSVLWRIPNLFLTPHSAGETHAYESNVLDILIGNIERLWRGDTVLINQTV